jgi:hypothetical protein
MCQTWGRIQIRIGIKMESRIQIQIGTSLFPIHNTVTKYIFVLCRRPDSVDVADGWAAACAGPVRPARPAGCATL